ncbi:hypothetical protein ARAM_003882 [Aspergillus rambellii]|uniref:PH domain-containing protein n=1 Tax=Aspergillus rambellii TaxID=308745 RepID=A0A0F8WDB1_9EURO|nr:hypothetical protein ARAM_003882 [Aspergillus rambellii]
MSTRFNADQHDGHEGMEVDPRSVFHNHHHGLEPGFYTTDKLRYATASHMHMTNRRFFIGPIPKGWLQSHRKSWYKTRLKLQNYTSKTTTFSAERATARETDPTPINYLPDAPENNEVEQPTQHLRNLSHPLGKGQEGSFSRYEVGVSADTDEENPVGESASIRPDTRSAYFTAREDAPTPANTGRISPVKPDQRVTRAQSVQERREQVLTIPSQNDSSQAFTPMVSSDAGSTAPLLRPQSQTQVKGKQPNTSSTNLEQQEPRYEDINEDGNELNDRRQLWHDHHTAPFSKPSTKYMFDDNLLDRQQRILSKVSNTQSMVPEWIYRQKTQEGEAIKAEKMLVRVEETMQDDLPEDYTEFDSLRVETRTQDNWREFLVICRSTSNKDAPFTLQMYKTRVIPEIQKDGRKVSPHYEISLGRKIAKVNLYSSLDKTIVIWNRSKRGTNIYILRPKSTAHAVEWYAFLTHTLGRRRPSSLIVNVPDLGVSLDFPNPFAQPQPIHGPKQQRDEATPNFTSMEQSACTSIVQRCIKKLETLPEWGEVLKEWSNNEKMGLAWKRYDRLEWVYGLNEERMHGWLTMQGTHELELRPRQHYDTSVSYGSQQEEEPKPVEGFLIRLTSQKGVHQRMNKMFFKRLYFFSQDHYLFFSKPSRSLPPTPPKLFPCESDIPSTQQILDEMPLSYDIDPFPLQGGEISWLSSGNSAHLKRHDEEAYAQLQRNIHNLSQSEGFINLCQVQEVRHVSDNSSTETDAQYSRGPGLNESATNHTSRNNSTVRYKDEVMFEMLLDNGLVVRFQAYSSATRDDWMKHLDALVKYWKARTAADTAELKSTRQRNLNSLGIDEELESAIGQFAKKWEVKKAEASPLLHNMCSLSGCRPIKMSGLLYKKPRRHGTFKKFHVVLTLGKLLIYHSSLRRRNGTEVAHIHYHLESVIELENCYIYSGLLTESDLLYANQTFDSNHPGHRALPRVYLSSDLYTSSDEDTAISFVVWQPLRKNLFRAQDLGEKGKKRHTLKQVSKLGVHGRTIVFKARSRVEKDRWVLSIASEIDELQEGKPEEVRLTSSR